MKGQNNCYSVLLIMKRYYADLIKFKKYILSQIRTNILKTKILIRSRYAVIRYAMAHACFSNEK